MSIPSDALHRLRAAVSRLPKIERPSSDFGDRFSAPDLVSLFIERLKETRAADDPVAPLVEVERAEDISAAIEARWGPFDPATWHVQGEPLVARDARIGLTPAAALIAASGTVVIDPPSADAGFASLLIEHHVVVAHVGQLIEDVQAFFTRLPDLRRAGCLGAYQVLVTGASRTADMEKILVIPAHGAARLSVVLCRMPFDWEAVRSEFVGRATPS